MLGTGYFLKIAKINSEQEKTSLFKTQNLVPTKHKKSPIRKNTCKLPQTFRATG